MRPYPDTPLTSRTAELSARVSPTVIVGEFGMSLLPVVARNSARPEIVVAPL